MTVIYTCIIFSSYDITSTKYYYLYITIITSIKYYLLNIYLPTNLLLKVKDRCINAHACVHMNIYIYNTSCLNV